MCSQTCSGHTVGIFKVSESFLLGCTSVWTQTGDDLLKFRDWIEVDQNENFEPSSWYKPHEVQLRRVYQNHHRFSWSIFSPWQACIASHALTFLFSLQSVIATVYSPFLANFTGHSSFFIRDRGANAQFHLQEALPLLAAPSVGAGFFCFFFGRVWAYMFERRLPAPVYHLPDVNQRAQVAWVGLVKLVEKLTDQDAFSTTFHEVIWQLSW